MIRSFLITNIPVVALLWAITYLADYYLTIISARMFRSHLGAYIAIEGSFELTPVYQKDVDALRLFSPNFLLRLVFSLLWLGIAGWLAVYFLDIPQLYTFMLGGLFLREAVVILRHFRNLALGRLSRGGAGLSGRLEQARWLSLRVSAAELLSFGIFFLILSLALDSFFFFGGGLLCVLTAWQHWRMGGKAKAKVTVNSVQYTE